MKRLILTSALALAVAAPAFASSQLAASAGVDASQYTTAQIIGILKAEEEGNWSTARFLRNNGGSVDVAVSTKGYGISAGHQQLAAGVGVDANQFTTDQIIELRKAEEEGDWSKANFIRKNASDAGTALSSKGSGLSAGHRQLAASLGVNAEDYSLSELVGLHGIQSQDNRSGD